VDNNAFAFSDFGNSVPSQPLPAANPAVAVNGADLISFDSFNNFGTAEVKPVVEQ